MSKTFKSIDDTRNLHVKSLGMNVVLSIEWPGEMRLGVTLAQSDIPAIMLALAEAAGLIETPSPYMQKVVDNLRNYILIEEKVDAEAEAQAELEAEALELYNACMTGLA